VIIVRRVSGEEAKAKFPDGWKAPKPIASKGWATLVETGPRGRSPGCNATETTDRRQRNNRNRVAVF
jgi:hypothetical protein